MEPGAAIELTRNPTWWGKPAAFGTVIIRIVENTAALEVNLRSGAIDYIAGELGLSLDQAAAMEEREGDAWDFAYKAGLIYEHIDLNPRQSGAGRCPGQARAAARHRPGDDLEAPLFRPAAGGARARQPARPGL